MCQANAMLTIVHATEGAPETPRGVGHVAWCWCGQHESLLFNCDLRIYVAALHIGYVLETPHPPVRL